MAISTHIHDFVKENTGTEGAVLNLTLSSIAGFARFGDVGDVGETVYYTILNGFNREVGLGTIQTNNVLSRTTPLTTLEEGVYTSPATSRIILAGSSTLAITPSAEVLAQIEKDITARSLLLIGA